MAKRATKSEEGTASPDPASAKSNANTPAKSNTPAKTTKAASKDKEKDATLTPSSGTKSRRQTKPRASNAGAAAAADKQQVMLGELQPVVKLAVVQVLALGLVTVGQMGVAAMSNNEMNGLRASKADGVEELVWQVGWRA
jgi:hypothetical protein